MWSNLWFVFHKAFQFEVIPDPAKDLLTYIQHELFCGGSVMVCDHPT